MGSDIKVVPVVHVRIPFEKFLNLLSFSYRKRLKEYASQVLLADSGVYIFDFAPPPPPDKVKNPCNDAVAGAEWSRIEPHHRVKPEPTALAWTHMFNIKNMFQNEETV
jgi:hypothetical protein